VRVVSPVGTTEIRASRFGRPYGTTGGLGAIDPSTEVLGYRQLPLRGTNLGRQMRRVQLSASMGLWTAPGTLQNPCDALAKSQEQEGRSGEPVLPARWWS
jgi:hypothetical protein